MPILFDPVHESEILRRSTQSWKTDHAALVYVVAENERTNEQMQELRRAFQREYKECPIEVVKKATNLPYQSAYSTALVATLLTPMEFAADTLYLSMKGFKDERAMIQILAHASKEEVEQLKKTYLRIRQRTLESDICKEFSGKERDFFLGLINAPRSHVDVAAAQDFIDRDVKELYIAGPGRGWSSDISAFIKIITKHDNEYLAALNVAYGRQYGDSLIRAVEKQFSNNVLGKGMGAMILDRSDYYASELNKAIAGVGTDTDSLTRIIATQRNTMPAICLRYMHKYRKNLRQHLQQESAVGDSNYGKVLQSMLKVAEATGNSENLSTTSEPSSTPSKPPQPHTSPSLKTCSSSSSGNPPPGQSLETQSSSSPANPPPGRSLETHSHDNLGRPSSGRSLASHSFNTTPLGRMGRVSLPGIPSYPSVPVPGAVYPSSDPYAPFTAPSSGAPTPGYTPAAYGTPTTQGASHGYPAHPYTATPQDYHANPYTAYPYNYPAAPGYDYQAYTAPPAQYPAAAYTYSQPDDGAPSCPPAPDYMANAFARLSANETDGAKQRAADAAEWTRKVAVQRQQEDVRYTKQVAEFYERTRVLEQQQRDAKIAADRVHAQRIEEGDAKLARELQEAEEEAANQRSRQQAAIAALEQSRREAEAAARSRAQEREKEDARYAHELLEADRQAAVTAAQARRELEEEQAAEQARARQREQADAHIAQQLQNELNAEEQRRRAALAEEQRRRDAAAAEAAAQAARRQQEEDARMAERLHKEQQEAEDARLAQQIADQENARR